MKISFVAYADVSLQYTKFICKTYNMVLVANHAHSHGQQMYLLQTLATTTAHDDLT